MQPEIGLVAESNCSLPLVNCISARFAFSTTALEVVIYKPSYEESVNMSRAISSARIHFRRGIRHRQDRKCMNFLFKAFAEKTFQQYNVMKMSCKRPSSFEESVIDITTFQTMHT